MDCLEIVYSGAVIKRVLGSGGQTQIECSEKLALEHSGWLALRARGVVAPEGYGGLAPWNLYAHTSPVYVLVNGHPIGVGADLTAMADYVRMLMEIYRRHGNLPEGPKRDELTANCNKAVEYYETLLEQSIV